MMYSELLKAIANTRLIFNTTRELEEFLGEDCIHNNTLLRRLPSEQRQRSAFRDLKGEVEEQTMGEVKLDQFIEEYKMASDFYGKHLIRKSDRQSIALDLLQYSHYPFDTTGINKKLLNLFDLAEREGINLVILTLLLLDALPGFNSREGDVKDIQTSWTCVMDALQTIISYNPLFQELPCFTSARNEVNKTRMMLYYHTSLVLDTFEAYSQQEDYYDVSRDLQQKSRYMELNGYWNTTGGELKGTEFWQLQSAESSCCYFATHWHKTADERLLGKRYTVHLFEHPDGGITFYILHPDAINHRINGKAYGDAEHSWYRMDDPATDSPQVLTLNRIVPSEAWPSAYQLTRVDDESAIWQYDKWQDKCTVEMEYPTYEFSLCLYAVTQEALYISNTFVEDDDTEYRYFRIPRKAFPGCERVQLCDKVGILTIEGRQYFAFDDFLLYIPVTAENMERYGIRVLPNID